MFKYKKTRQHCMGSRVENVFDCIDKQIREALDKSNMECDKALWEIYNTFSLELKKIKGTSSGFSGLSEYIFFKALLLQLEAKGFKLEPSDKAYIEGKQKEDRTYCFISEDKTVIVTHDLSIYPKVQNQIFLERKVPKNHGRSIKPDIAVFKKKNGKYEPVAVFEIKIYCVNADSLEKDIEKMGKFVGEGLKFSILSIPPKKNYTSTVKEANKSQVKFIINPSYDKDGKCPLDNKICFKKAVDKVVEELKRSE
ncbi:MAG: hypothetical protein GY861_09385 [bacterium]|nr:hypothetical protein [bacterium]